MKFIAALIPAFANLLATFAGKLLVSLGITAVTYVGLERVVKQFTDKITSNVTGVPHDILQIFYISGGGVALNIILGAFTFYVSVKGVTQLTSRLGKK